MTVTDIKVGLHHELGILTFQKGCKCYIHLSSQMLEKHHSQVLLCTGVKYTEESPHLLGDDILVRPEAPGRKGVECGRDRA